MIPGKYKPKDLIRFNSNIWEIYDEQPFLTGDIESNIYRLILLSDRGGIQKAGQAFPISTETIDKHAERVTGECPNCGDFNIRDIGYRELPFYDHFDCFTCKYPLWFEVYKRPDGPGWDTYAFTQDEFFDVYDVDFDMKTVRRKADGPAARANEGESQEIPI